MGEEGWGFRIASARAKAASVAASAVETAGRFQSDGINSTAGEMRSLRVLFA